MQLFSKIHLILLTVVFLFIIAIAGDIDTKEQIEKTGVLWKKQ